MMLQVDPVGGESREVTDTEEQLSVAVGLPCAPTLRSDPQGTLRLGGKLAKTGGVLSTVVMIWTAEAEPAPVVAVHVRVMVVCPVHMVLTESEKVIVGAEHPVPVAVPVVVGEVEEPQGTLRSGGGMTVGGMVNPKLIPVTS